MTTEQYYGEKFETPLIIVISTVIVLAMFGAWKLMSLETHGCRVSEYTYCGEKVAPQH
jgi:hypothetical protein